jgi:hypothetical protein
MKTVGRPRVLLGLLTLNYPHLIGRGYAVHTGIVGHPALFVNPNPPMPVLGQAVQDLDQAQQATVSRAAGAVEVRNHKARIVITHLGTTQAYVQSLIDNDPEQAGIIASAASMYLAQPRAYVKPIIQATQEHPGAPVHVVANVGLLTADVSGYVFFNWQMSGDGGKTWLDLPATPHGDTTVTGLTPLTTCDFRVRITSRKGPGPWSQAVTVLVR